MANTKLVLGVLAGIAAVATVGLLVTKDDKPGMVKKIFPEEVEKGESLLSGTLKKAAGGLLELLLTAFIKSRPDTKSVIEPEQQEENPLAKYASPMS